MRTGARGWLKLNAKVLGVQREGHMVLHEHFPSLACSIVRRRWPLLPVKHLYADFSISTVLPLYSSDLRWGVCRAAAAASRARTKALYGLGVLDAGVHTVAGSVTRFLVLSRDPAITSPTDQRPHKTSLVFALPEGPNRLYEALSVFRLRNLDICKARSTPPPLSLYDTDFTFSLKAAQPTYFSRVTAFWYKAMSVQLDALHVGVWT